MGDHMKAMQGGMGMMREMQAMVAGSGTGGMGMMGGMRGGPAREEKPVAYEPSIWGRYAKVLLSSSEFLFIN